MAKKKDLENIYYPVPKDFAIEKADKPPISTEVIRRIIQGAVKGAYKLKTPSLWDYHGNPIKPKAIASPEQMEMITHLIESLQPADAIEAALASQFAITYIRGIQESATDYSNDSTMMELFKFGHQVLEALTKYRTKGAQLISVNYNHNQGQINNIEIVDKKKQPETIEVH